MLEQVHSHTARHSFQSFIITQRILIVVITETKKSKLIKRVPKGMSDYQACWIPDVEEKETAAADDDDDASDEDMSDDDDDDDDDSDEEDFMSCASDRDSADEFEKDQNEDDNFDTVTVSEAPINDEKYDLGESLSRLDHC